MKKLLFIAHLKPGMLSAYQHFAATITGPRKEEYKDLLHRYGLTSTSVYLHHDMVLIYHEAENDALERLSRWAASKHPFDEWFGQQLNNCYKEGWSEAKLLFQFDSR